MKSERISIFNYEAFYLDHLEGTLGEEDTVLLLDFLEDHPDLIVEEEDFVMLDPKDDIVIFADKESLKIVSDDAAIVLSNVEHFLVAEAEGQLTASKQKELNAFVSQHSHLEKERTYLAAMFLKADTSIVYANKSGLKRKGAIIFWPYIALAAASVLIAFLFVMNFEQEAPGIAEDDLKDKKESPKQEMPIQERDKVQLADDIVPSNSADESISQPTNQDLNKKMNTNQRMNAPRNFTPQRQQVALVNTLKSQKPRGLLNSMDKKDLQPVASFINSQAASTLPEDDLAQVEAIEMKNPIKPITSRLGKTLKTSVDFQTGKAANNTGAGFFLKIGKLEISHKKGKKSKN